MILITMKTSWDAYWDNELNRSYWLEPDKVVTELIATLYKPKTKDILDLGCGIGRHTIFLAEAGYNVTAVDSSQEALDILKYQVDEKGLKVIIINGNYSEELFPENSFDLIIAYNVIYHGYREDFAQAVHLVCKWLRSDGLFFFTCPSRKDDRYGNGEKVAPNTYKPLNSIHPVDIHYFADEADISDFLHEFSEISKDTYEHYWDNKGVQQFGLYWQILAKK